MRRRSGLLIAGLTIAGMVLATTSAFAKPIEKGHFHDVFTSDVYDCEGTPARTRWTSRATSWATCAAHHRSRTSATACTAPWSPPTWTPAAPSPRSSPATAGTTRSWTTVMARSPSPSRPPVVSGSTTPTATSCSRTPVTFGSPSTSTSNGTPGDPSDDEDVPDSFQDGARIRPGATIPRAATSVTTCGSSRPSHLCVSGARQHPQSRSVGAIRYRVAPRTLTGGRRKLCAS